MNLKLEDVYTALKKKGFVPLNDKSKILVFKSNRSIMFKPPFSLPILQSGKAEMAAQIEMPVSFFLDMVECKKSREDYIRELARKRLSDS